MNRSLKSYNKHSRIVYFIKDNVLYFHELDELHNDSAFLLERIKPRKDGNLLGYLYDKKEYAYSIKNFR